MRIANVAVATLLIALGCSAPEAPKTATTASTAPGPTAPVAQADQLERDNLLNVAYGASVVSRTAEMSLENSALRAIDGDPESPWNSPPDDTHQTLVFALAAPARIEKVGARVPPVAAVEVRGLQFDASLDGVNFAPVATVKLVKSPEVQLFPVRPVDAIYIRVTTTDVPASFAGLQSVQVRGRFLGPPIARPIDGCWNINGLPAAFETAGGSTNGSIGAADPVLLTGGAEGTVYRLAWIRKGDWGFAAMNISPDGRHLSGMRWYQEPIPYDFGGSWFGEKAQCGGVRVASPAAAVMRRFLDRLHRYPLYGLHFDGRDAVAEPDSAAALDVLLHVLAQPSSQRIRMVSREYRYASPDENRRRAQARLDSLRAVLQKRGADLASIEFVAVGSDRPPQRIDNEIMRVLYSGVDVELPLEER